MIKKHNRLSLLFGIPGFFMQGFLFIWGQEVWGLLGILLFMIGLAFHAKSLGRSPFWGLVGFFSWFSLIVLIFLKDKTSSLKRPLEKIFKTLPQRVGHFSAEQPRAYEAKEHGMSLGYNAPDGATLTLYLYDLGLSTVPDGIGAEVIQREKESALSAIREHEQTGVYRNLVFSGEKVMTLPHGTGRSLEILYVDYRSELKLPDGSFCPKVSMLSVTGACGYILKIRGSWDPSGSGDAVLDAVRTLVSDLAK